MKPNQLLLALLSVLTVALGACTSTSGHGSAVGANRSSSGSSAGSSPAASSSSSSTPPPKPKTVVHVTSLENDGTTWGVGMPIVLYFSPVPASSKAFTAAAKVTVNGQPANGAWYWEQPTAYDVQHHIVEAHYREQSFWPHNAQIHVSLPIGGLSAGGNMVYSDKLTSLDFSIGDSHVSYVDGQTLQMRVLDNGRLVRTMPVSLGTPDAPTYNGTKVVMQKGEDIPGTDQLRPNGTVLMSSESGHYTNVPVQWSVRVTQSGEYVHAAPWNSRIGAASTSHGCTNLHTADGEWFYNFSNVGDVVVYANTDGGRMPSWDGLGDWNVPWGQWQQGGLLVNH